MPLQKQQVAVNFQKGLDTKSDPWQVPIGNFLELENTVFTKQGLLQKRDGFQQISTINDSSVSCLSIYNNELTALGDSVYAYNKPNQEFINKGLFYSVGVTAKQLTATNSDIHQVDAVTSSSGATCVVYWESINPNVNSFKYSVFNSITGQSLLNATNIVPSAGVVSGVPKVFLFLNYFIVIYPISSGGQSLEFFAININNLATTATTTIAPNYTPNPNVSFIFADQTGLSWDAVVCGNKIAVGYNQGAGGFYVNFINSDLSASTTTSIDNTITPSAVGAMTDDTSSYFVYYDYTTGLGSIVGINMSGANAATLWAPQSFLNLGGPQQLPNITGSVTNNVITVIYEQVYAYQYFPSYPSLTATGNYGYNYSNQIYKRTCSTSGVVGAAPASAFVKGVGLASKSFVYNDDIYFASTYSFGNGFLDNPIETNQPCYFVHDINGDVVTQLQYRNGAGYYSVGGIPNVTVEKFSGVTTLNSSVVTGISDTSTLSVGQRVVSGNFNIHDVYIESIDSSTEITLSKSASASGSSVFYNNVVTFPYLYQAVIQNFGGSQSGLSIKFGFRGVKLAVIEFNKTRVKTVEAGQNLNIASGFLWNYDGVSATENNFFLYPDSIYVQGAPNLVLTCNTTNNSTTVTTASTVGLYVGQFVSGTGISFGVTYTKTCQITTGSQIVTVPNIDNLVVGQLISGTGIPALSTITAIQTSTSITISSPATATNAAVSLSFGGGTTISAILNGTSFTVSNAATATATNQLTFYGKMQTGNYQYTAIYEYIDNTGNTVRSSPATPFVINIQPSSVISATSNSNNTLTNISSSDFAKLQLGQSVSGTFIAANSYITGLDSTDPANLKARLSIITSGSGPTTVTTQQISQANINIPTLRISYKNVVNIIIYRALTSTGSVFEQLTPAREPLENDPTVDYLTYRDLKSNAEILGNTTLYITGGILDNVVAPYCSDCIVFDGRVWLISENKAWYSKPLLEATPVAMNDAQTLFVQPLQNYQGTTGNLTALSVMDDKLILFKKNAIYYINGNGPDETGANSQYSEPILITATVGTDNPFSITYNPLGIVFQTDKGLWILGRDLSTSYFGAPVERFTQNATVTSANLITGTTQTRLCLDSGITLMYDYFYGQWGSFTNIPNLSSVIYDGLHTFFDQYGRICQETPNTYLDVTNPVLMKFKTNWFALAGIQGFQRAYFLFLLGKYYSPHKLNIEVAYDFNEGFTQSTIITPDNYASVYGNDPFYGSGNVWGGASQVEKWRIMLDRQKCDTLQFQLSEIYDPSYGTQAGQGLTISGINLIVGIKKGYGTISQFNTAS